MTRTIYFVRHGETAWNTEARLQGQTDTPLNDVGRGQAAEVAKKLAALAPEVATLPFLVSPLRRTRETAEIVRQALGMPAEGYALDPRIAEISYGAWEGLTWRDIRRDFAELYAERNRDRWNFTPPNGESYAALARRVEPIIETLPKVSVLVSHGGIARVLLHLLTGLPEEDAPNLDIWQGRVLVFGDDGHRWD